MSVASACLLVGNHLSTVTLTAFLLLLKDGLIRQDLFP